MKLSLTGSNTHVLLSSSYNVKTVMTYYSLLLNTVKPGLEPMIRPLPKSVSIYVGNTLYIHVETDVSE